MTEPRYLVPDRFSRRIMNPAIAGLARLGIGLRGAHELKVRGRVSGEWRSVPVNPLTVDGVTYLVAPRGCTEWVRNLRAAGDCELRLGRRTISYAATEINEPEAKAPLLRTYLRRWRTEVGRYFGELTVDSTLDEFVTAADGYPVFALTTLR